MIARGQSENLEELMQFVQAWSSKSSCRLKELQSLVRKLSHACAVFLHGRTFLRRLLHLLKGWNHKKLHFIRLNKDCMLHIAWWHSFLKTWNWVHFLIYGGGYQFQTFVYRQMHRVVWDTVHS